MKKLLTSIFYKKNWLYIDWDIGLDCNLKCSYCYHLKKLNLPEYRENIENIKLTLEFLNSVIEIYDFTLGLLGGEPTIQKNFNFIIKKLNKIFNKKNNSDFFISTNGFFDIKSFDFYINKEKINNSRLWVSIHPEFYSKKYLKNLKKNIINLSPFIERFVLSPMLFKIEKYQNFIDDIYQLFKELKNNKIRISYSPSYIHDKEEKKYKIYDPNIKKFNQDIQEFNLLNKKITYNEYLKKFHKNNIFKNSFCYVKYLYIDYKATLHFDCHGFEIDLLTLKEETNNFQKEKLKKFLSFLEKPLVCKNNTCNDFPKLLFEKKLKK